MVKPLVTIIVPVYNLEAYVAHGLKSLIEQTYSHLQIIVIDDASKDHSPQIIAHFAELDSRIQPILKQVNHGVSAARNSGLALAKGDLVAFMDGDDWYEPDFIGISLRCRFIGMILTRDRCMRLYASLSSSRGKA